MKIAVYESRLANLGGGGRHALMAALALAESHEVEFWHDRPVDPAVLQERWNVSIESLTMREMPHDDAFVSAMTAGLDGFINAAQGRFIQPRARHSAFLSFFPTGVDLSLSGRTRWMAGTLIRAAGLGGLLPARLQQRLATLPTWSEIQALAAYDAIFANSEYTRRWVRHYWHRDSLVLHPPIEMLPPLPKENIILHVGRFFVGGHNKKHDVLVEGFRALLARLPAGERWELFLAGSITPGANHQAYADRIRDLASGLPVRIHLALDHAALATLFGRARIYWHATGYGADLRRSPDQAEHFGMSIVEAMSAGAVPVVFAEGGPAEIITPGQDGLVWRTPESLVEETLELIQRPDRLATMASAAITRSRAFERRAFMRQMRALWDGIVRGGGC
ncbi:MAG: glycosyltransferase family 4 protein [Thermoflexales bacterium]|nr:glycosyltransferase family 4 protein [Thermoflexales bacterium]